MVQNAPPPPPRRSLDDFPADVITDAMDLRRAIAANGGTWFAPMGTRGAFLVYVLEQCGHVSIRGGQQGDGRKGWIVEGGKQ